jgi:glycosyltransferase involved in cell wall biosynthesis
MHIGFDISQTGFNRAGCGFFAHAMAQAMLKFAPENSYSLFPTFGDFYFDSQMPTMSPYSGVSVHYGPLHNSREEAGEYWRHPEVEDRIGRPDVVHANNFWAPIQLQSSRLIYTLYDLGFATEPSWSTEANRVGCFEGMFRASIAADWVIAISAASRQHYLSMFPHFPEDRVRVIYPCSRFADSGAKGQPPKSVERIAGSSFWLTVGTIEPRKNQRRLLDAYARYLALGGTIMPMVLAGGAGWLMGDFEKYISDSGLAEYVVMTGYVSDDELIWLYRNCYANLYPSLFEGFGLPVLEGMQFGAPTIASQSSSIPEVIGDAGILLAPDDTDSWTQALLNVAASKGIRDQMSRAAVARAGSFDWRNSAEALLQVYEEAVAMPKQRAGVSR